MKEILIINNSPGSVSVKHITNNGKNVMPRQLQSYAETNESLELELGIGDMIVIENEGDEFD